MRRPATRNRHLNRTRAQPGSFEWRYRGHRDVGRRGRRRLLRGTGVRRSRTRQRRDSCRVARVRQSRRRNGSWRRRQCAGCIAKAIQIVKAARQGSVAAPGGIAALTVSQGSRRSLVAGRRWCHRGRCDGNDTAGVRIKGHANGAIVGIERQHHDIQAGAANRGADRLKAGRSDDGEDFIGRQSRNRRFMDERLRLGGTKRRIPQTSRRCKKCNNKTPHDKSPIGAARAARNARRSQLVRTRTVRIRTDDIQSWKSGGARARFGQYGALAEPQLDGDLGSRRADAGQLRTQPNCATYATSRPIVA